MPRARTPDASQASSSEVERGFGVTSGRETGTFRLKRAPADAGDGPQHDRLERPEMGGERGGGARHAEQRQAGGVEDGNRPSHAHSEPAGEEGGDAGAAADGEVPPVPERGGR